tara:strand:+ start:328 stop:483 length:156 start_codon:yes stop_codon:yes gene_type:complete
MKKTKIILWFIWLVLVIAWNYGYPDASPFWDVLVAAVLSMLNVIILKFYKK